MTHITRQWKTFRETDLLGHYTMYSMEACYLHFQSSLNYQCIQCHTPEDTGNTVYTITLRNFVGR
jgi:hypothetical protein